jgi:copper chaperone CopZ
MTTAVYTFRVEGMHCASCGLLIDDELDDLDGVLAAQTSVRRGTSTVTVDPARCGPQDVIAAIASVGYQAEPQE